MRGTSFSEWRATHFVASRIIASIPRVARERLPPARDTVFHFQGQVDSSEALALGDGDGGVDTDFRCEHGPFFDGSMLRARKLGITISSSSPCTRVAIAHSTS